MKMMTKAIVGAEVAKTAVTVVDRLIVAYETSKRLDFEKARLQAEHGIERRKLGIFRQALDAKIAENNRRLSFEARAVRSYLRDSRVLAKDFRRSQRRLDAMLNRLFGEILSDRADSARREAMMQLYRQIEGRMASARARFVAESDARYERCHRGIESTCRALDWPDASFGGHDGSGVRMIGKEVR